MTNTANPQIATQPRLRVWEEKPQGFQHEFVLDKPAHTLGRVAPSDLVVPVATVSREHARLERQPDGSYRIVDLNSANGLYVNGNKVTDHVLRNGETVEIGRRGGNNAVIALQFVQPAPPPIPHNGPVSVVMPPPIARTVPTASQPQPVAAYPPYVNPSAAPIRNSGPQQPPQTSILAGMAPVLRVTVSNSQFKLAQTLDQPRMTIGRDDSCTITLPFSTVSRHHATLDQVGQSADGPLYRISDNGSSNGLYLNGQQIQERVLQRGDVLTIGKTQDRGYVVSLAYLVGAEAYTPDVEIAPRNLNSIAELIIGRAPESGLQLVHPVVSARHARIAHKQNGELTIEDLGSTNGTLLNGLPLKPNRAVPLRPDSIIQIGAWRLRYDNQGFLTAANDQGIVRLDAYDLTVTVQNKGRPKIILNDVSLSVQPREFVAVLGGSGAGKSTLMMALNGSRPADPPNSHVLFNGGDLYRTFDSYRSLIGYVPQADIIHTDLPVRTALDYAAQLRLPGSTTPPEREKRVRSVIQSLRLTGSEDTVVGQLSGGQRKRVSIGVELLTEPSLFFLDEPTSGLDPGLEGEMMVLMRELAERGHTIILVTHALANIDKCHKVAIMAYGGRLVYFGTAAAAIAHFGVKDGFHSIYNITSLDVVVANGQLSLNLPDDVADWVAQIRQEFEGDPAIAALPINEIQQRWSARLEEHFRRTPAYNAATPNAAPPPPVPPSAAPQSLAPTGAGSFGKTVQNLFDLRQFRILSRRYLDILRRDRATLIFLLAQAPIIGLILGLVGRDLFRDPTTDPNLGRDEVFQKLGNIAVDSPKLIALLGCAVIWFGILNSVREIVKELPIYKRERMVNLSIGSYLLSKVVVLVGLSLVQVAVLLLVTLPLTGIPKGIPLFSTDSSPTLAVIELYITLVLSMVNGVTIGLLISSSLKNNERVSAITPLALLPQIILAPILFSTLFAPFVTSGWAIWAIGSIADYNGTRQSVNPPIGLNDGDTFNYAPTFLHLLLCWFVLLLFAALFLGLTYRQQQRKDKQVG